MLITTGSALLSAVAYGVLTAGGAVQWKRARSVTAAMVAIGFGMVFIDQVVELVEYVQVSALLRDHAVDTLFVVHHHAFMQYISLLGLWLAAVGLMRHSLRISRG
jgi:hypothetical protein